MRSAIDGAQGQRRPCGVRGAVHGFARIPSAVAIARFFRQSLNGQRISRNDAVGKQARSAFGDGQRCHLRLVGKLRRASAGRLEVVDGVLRGQIDIDGSVSANGSERNGISRVSHKTTAIGAYDGIEHPSVIGIGVGDGKIDFVVVLLPGEVQLFGHRTSRRARPRNRWGVDGLFAAAQLGMIDFGARSVNVVGLHGHHALTQRGRGRAIRVFHAHGSVGELARIHLVRILHRDLVRIFIERARVVRLIDVAYCVARVLPFDAVLGIRDRIGYADVRPYGFRRIVVVERARFYLDGFRHVLRVRLDEIGRGGALLVRIGVHLVGYRIRFDPDRIQRLISAHRNRLHRRKAIRSLGPPLERCVPVRKAVARSQIGSRNHRTRLELLGVGNAAGCAVGIVGERYFLNRLLPGSRQRDVLFRNGDAITRLIHRAIFVGPSGEFIAGPHGRLLDGCLSTDIVHVGIARHRGDAVRTTFVEYLVGRKGMVFCIERDAFVDRVRELDGRSRALGIVVPSVETVPSAAHLLDVLVFALGARRISALEHVVFNRLVSRAAGIPQVVGGARLFRRLDRNGHVDVIAVSRGTGDRVFILVDRTRRAGYLVG